jgi:hypothetical protein
MAAERTDLRLQWRCDLPLYLTDAIQLPQFATLRRNARFPRCGGVEARWGRHIFSS